MKASDWKKFNHIKQEALERFCTRILNEADEVISNAEEQVHDRYRTLYKLIQSQDEEMALMFDGHSRSQAQTQLLAMRVRGLVGDSLIAELSDELRQNTNP